MEKPEHPDVVVLAGPNGSGKSTTAPALLRDCLGLTEFVNADVLAEGLSAFDPLSAALDAGRLMLDRLRYLAARRASFAFETTLAPRSLAPWLADLVASGYHFHLLFLWLPSPDLAVVRVQTRVQLGGHDVPEETIRRRYTVGLRNFFTLYQPIATIWRVYDNSGTVAPEMIAAGQGNVVDRVFDDDLWTAFRRAAQNED